VIGHIKNIKLALRQGCPNLQQTRWFYVAHEISLPFPKICVNASISLKKVTNLVEKTLQKVPTNIPCIFSIDFTQHPISSLHKCGTSMAP
jgi:hypothetical protein